MCVALIPIVFEQSQCKRVCLCLCFGLRERKRREKARNKDPSVREANMSPLSSPNCSPGTHARDNSLVARVVVFGFFAHRKGISTIRNGNTVILITAQRTRRRDVHKHYSTVEG